MATSSTYSPRPRRKRRSSRRSIGVPMKVFFMASLLVMLAGVEHRLDDADVPGAAADVAREHLAHPVGVAVRFLGEQGMRRGDEARRTEAALQRVVLAEALLQRRKIGVLGQTFDGCDLGSFGLHREHQAR